MEKDIAIEGLTDFELPVVEGEASAPRVHVSDSVCESCQ
jgi:hypothetical protein